MPAPSTWQIVPSAGGQFRWISVTAGAAAEPRVEEPPGAPIPEAEGPSSSRLPSMADLFLQAPPELLENGGGRDDNGVPMFRTGSGRSVSVRRSSIQKAMSVLESGDQLERGGLDNEDGRVGKEGFPVFHTGSGKSVAVKQSSIRKAAALLEEENLQKGSLKPPKGNGRNNGIPRFCTGSGNSILLEQSSIKKALSVPKEEESTKKDRLLKETTNSNCNFSNTLFQTGSGKTVNISSSGLTRATKLLGLEGSSNISFAECFEHMMVQASTNLDTISENSHGKVRWDMKCGTGCKFNFDGGDIQSVKTSLPTCSRDLYSLGITSNMNAYKKSMGSICSTDSAQNPIELKTAGGRYIPISSDALKRAKSLLGDPELTDQDNAVKVDVPPHSDIGEERTLEQTSWNKENYQFACLQKNTETGKYVAKALPHMQSSSKARQSYSSHEVANFQGAMRNQINVKCFDSEGIHLPNSYIRSKQKPFSKDRPVTCSSVDILEKMPDCRTFCEPLADISNCIGINSANKNGFPNEKKRPGGRCSISPFKRPRISRFTSPLESKSSFQSSGSSLLSTSETSCCRARMSSRYPFDSKRKTIEEFFGRPPAHCNRKLQHLPDEVKHINADNAEKYRFHDTSSGGIGPDAFQNMLLQSGASMLNATKKWVANHYKWIVWKLACLERGYPSQACGKYLTVPNVLEELKYRYEREFNHGHRSAIKRILDGDASPSSMIILCVSAVRSYPDVEISKVEDTNGLYEEKKLLGVSNGAGNMHSLKIELTDGWYSLDACLDALLSKQLSAGKLFIGQKLRIWGAGLCGWVGPVSPFDVRACHGKGLGAPLAFSCIKGSGGKLPWTLVGVTRVYPVLYKERFPDGGSIVRSERMEKKALQLYNQRRHSIAEDIMSEPQGGYVNDDDSEDGAKIFKILETAAEPEVLMADMSSEQLFSFSNYQAKKEAIRQSDMKKKIEKALEEAGLSSREVTPFMRVRVVGLTRKGSSRKGRPREGLITIWNPSEEQKVDLVEGHTYSVAGLVPLSFGSEVMYLQGRGSSILWKPIISKEIENFEPFFTPRRSTLLSNLGEVPLASEFDIAAVIVHIGDVCLSGRQKKQWVFVTDGSNCHSDLQIEEPYSCLLAVSFCSPVINDDSSPLMSHTLSGSTVAFSNLVKRTRDEMNHLWVAEATEVSTYSTCHSLPSVSHLKEAALSAQKWAKISFSAIQNLRERVLCIIGAH